MKKIYQTPESLTVALNVKCTILDGSQDQITTPIGDGEVGPSTGNLVKGHRNVWDDDEDWD